MQAAQEQRMQSHMNFVRSNPGMQNQLERNAAERYFAEKFRDERAAADDAYRDRELGTREKVAGFGWMGHRDAGSTAAGLTADAQLKGIEAQAQRDRDLQKGQLDYDRWRTGRTLESEDAKHRREWGELDPDGKYTPGGRGFVAKTQGEAQRENARLGYQTELEKARILAEGRKQAAEITAQGKERAARLVKEGKLASALAGMALLPGMTPEKMEAYKAKLGEQAGTLADAGLSDEEIEEVMKKRMEKERGTPPQGKVNQQTASYKEAAEKRLTD